MIGMSNLGRSSGGAGGAPMPMMMMGGGGGGPSYMQRDTSGDFANPLQSIQNMSGRFGFNRNARPQQQQQQPMMSTPSDRYLITDDANETPN